MPFERFTAETAALLLVDHQVGTMGWVGSISFDDMKRNALMLAKTAAILKMPVVLTSSMEEYAQGPLLPELADILPHEFAARIKRLGIVNAMDDTAFADRAPQDHSGGRHQRCLHRLSGADAGGAWL